MIQSKNTQKTALITGAGKRIGRGIALDLARHGWDIAVHYNSSNEEAQDLAAEIDKIGRRVVVLKADLANHKDVMFLLPNCVDALGVPTCLINNASLFEYDDLSSMTEQMWSAHLDVNVKAPLFLSQSFARFLPDTTTGNIINIIDQRVWRLTPLFFSYTVSKAALWAATQTMAQSLAPRIRVNAVGPGPVLKSIHQTQDQFDTQCLATLLERGTTPDEIAAAIRFIIDAPAMTGQMIALDGGQHLSWKTADVFGAEG